MKADDLERETRETRIGFRIAWAVAAAGFLAQMLWNGKYGYFRGELIIWQQAIIWLSRMWILRRSL